MLDYISCDSLTPDVDCASQASACWCRRRSLWRVALFFHHSICWWYRTSECRLEDMDLDGLVLFCGNLFRLFHVSRGKHLDIAPERDKTNHNIDYWKDFGGDRCALCQGRCQAYHLGGTVGHAKQCCGREGGSYIAACREILSCDL